MLAFTFLDVFFKYANSNESLTTAGVWSEAGVFEQQLQEVSNSSAVAVEVAEAGPGCRIEDRCSVSVSACIVNPFSLTIGLGNQPSLNRINISGSASFPITTISGILDTL